MRPCLGWREAAFNAARASGHDVLAPMLFSALLARCRSRSAPRCAGRSRLRRRSPAAPARRKSRDCASSISAPLGDPAQAPWKNIILHQTEGAAGLGARAGRAPGRRIRRKRGVTLWVETDGTVYWATPETVITTHGDGANRNDNKYIDNSKTYRQVIRTNSIGVEFNGNSPDVRKPPTPEQFAAWLVLVRFLQERYGIPAERVYAHNWIDYKDAPLLRGLRAGGARPRAGLSCPAGRSRSRRFGRLATRPCCAPCAAIPRKPQTLPQEWPMHAGMRHRCDLLVASSSDAARRTFRCPAAAGAPLRALATRAAPRAAPRCRRAGSRCRPATGDARLLRAARQGIADFTPLPIRSEPAQCGAIDLVRLEARDDARPHPSAAQPAARCCAAPWRRRWRSGCATTSGPPRPNSARRSPRSPNYRFLRVPRPQPHRRRQDCPSTARAMRSTSAPSSFATARVFNLTDPLVSKPFREQMRDARPAPASRTVLGPGSDGYHKEPHPSRSRRALARLSDLPVERARSGRSRAAEVPLPRPRPGAISTAGRAIARGDSANENGAGPGPAPSCIRRRSTSVHCSAIARPAPCAG